MISCMNSSFSNYSQYWLLIMLCYDILLHSIYIYYYCKLNCVYHFSFGQTSLTKFLWYAGPQKHGAIAAETSFLCPLEAEI